MTAVAPQRFAAPRDVVCPTCSAQPGRPCTQPTNTAHKPVGWHHLARERVPARYTCIICGDREVQAGQLKGALLDTVEALDDDDPEAYPVGQVTG